MSDNKSTFFVFLKRLNTNRKFFFLFLIGLFTGHNLYAQNQDTLLVKLESKPFFYNVLTTPEGVVLAGTSEGIFKISGSDFEKFDNRPGYIGIGDQGMVLIEGDGIKNYVERQFLHLLPYPERVREEFHTGSGDFFYIVSNGILYFFEIVPFKTSYQNSSVRTISPNFVGTYSGVFFRNQKLRTPPFSDGYIREFGDKAFLCYNDLIIRKLPASGEELSEENEISHSFFGNTVEDVFYSSLDKRYYVATIGSFARLSQDLKSYDLLYTTEKGNMAFLGEMKNSIVFASNESLINYSITSKSLDTLYQHTEPILDGYTSIRNYYFLTESGFHGFYSDGSHKKLTDLQVAHTVLPISTTESVIATNNGLWYFNTSSSQLSVLIPGIEFNKKALFIGDNKINAGSIKGLYTFSIAAIPELIKRNQSTYQDTVFKYRSEVALGVLIFMILIGVLVSQILKARKKIKLLKDQVIKSFEREDDYLSELMVSRDQIEDFIKSKLSEASLKSITDHFNITTSQVYSILKPDKPGTIIQKHRIGIVIDMKNKGLKAPAIAKATGFSESYLRKIKSSK